MIDSPDKQLIYSGEYRHTIDAKHRVTIPARWRDERGEAEYFAVPDAAGSFLMVMPSREFDRVKRDAEMNTRISPGERRKFIRRFYALARLVVVDKQGRVLLPEEYCSRLGLEGEVTLVGSHSRIEIWNTARWTAASVEDEDTYRRVAEEVGL